MSKLNHRQEPPNGGSDQHLVRILDSVPPHATECRPYYYEHPYNEPKCACDWPRIWLSWPLECRNCGRILPDTNDESDCQLDDFERNTCMKCGREIRHACSLCDDCDEVVSREWNLSNAEDDLSPLPAVESCPICNGRGAIRVSSGMFEKFTKCSKCQGGGVKND